MSPIWGAGGQFLSRNGEGRPVSTSLLNYKEEAVGNREITIRTEPGFLALLSVI